MPTRVEALRHALRTSRDVCRSRSHAYGLLYDVLGWTKAPIRSDMLNVVDQCIEDIEASDCSEGSLWDLRKRLLQAGFSTSPEIDG